MAGDAGFDPFGFSSIFDIKWLRARGVRSSRPPPRFAILGGGGNVSSGGGEPVERDPDHRPLIRREAEIKHGRITMLAWTGFVATDLGFTLPGDMHQISSVAAHDVATKYGAMQQILLWLGFIEVVQAFGITDMMWYGSARQPGDFGLDPLDFCSTPEKKLDMQTKEITHCRLAMFAFSGVVTQAVLTGKGFPYF